MRTSRPAIERISTDSCLATATGYPIWAGDCTSEYADDRTGREAYTNRPRANEVQTRSPVYKLFVCLSLIVVSAASLLCQKHPVFRANSHTVVLTFSVSDSHGRYLKCLGARDFR